MNLTISLSTANREISSFLLTAIVCYAFVENFKVVVR